MLNNISWSQYWIIILLTSLCYYLFIWVAYYKASLSFMKVGRRSFLIRDNNAVDSDSLDIHLIAEDLKPLFLNRMNKSELMLVLKEKLQSYHEITDPGFRGTLNQFLISESLHKCSIRLDDDDLRALWK